MLGRHDILVDGGVDVFEAIDAEVDCLGGPRPGEVAGHRNTAGNPADEGLHQIRAEAGVELEAIDSAGKEIVHRGFGPGCVFDDPGQVAGAATTERPVAEDGRDAIEQGAVGEDARAEFAAGSNLIAQREHPFGRTTNIADGCDPGAEPDRQRLAATAKFDVDVHIDEAGDDELAGRVEDAGAGWRLELAGRIDGANATIAYLNAGAALRGSAGAVEDGGVLDEDRFGQ